ncbi:MAG TPA: hypothetical protein VK338_05965 [Candidatus Nitrosocosmicus sp.]|nr:hypothetical protein [Candidatus Nitrosocosmicus sp.]
MYEDTYDATLLFQGDIIDNIEFYLYPFNSIQDCETQKPSEEPHKEIFKKDYSIKHAITYTNIGIILSQNCDIDNRKFILLAPVFPVSKRYPNNNNHLIDLRKHRINYEIHLPHIKNLPESFADLQLIVPYYKEKINLANRIAVLSIYGRSLLQQHLRDFFGRVEISLYIQTEQGSS